MLSVYIYNEPETIEDGRLLVNNVKRVRPSTEPCGIPLGTAAGSDCISFKVVNCFLSFKQSFSHSNSDPVMPNCYSSIFTNVSCGTQLNAFLKSTNAAATIFLESNSFLHICVRWISRSSVE